ncbi:MAG: hypothetical protein RLZZ152_619, partial [Pseudomonadota bacterium]
MFNRGISGHDKNIFNHDNEIDKFLVRETNAGDNEKILRTIKSLNTLHLLNRSKNKSN